MPKRNPYRFTRKETVDRIQEVKHFLGNKERIAFRPVLTKAREIMLPPGYDSRLDESYYNAPPLSSESISFLEDRVRTGLGIAEADVILSLGKNFYQGGASQFVDAVVKKALCGAVVELVFYSWVRHDFRPYTQPSVNKFVCLWLGTWHHCPIIAWSNGIGPNTSVKTEHLPKYIDLIK